MSRDDATVFDIVRAADLASDFAGTLDRAAFFADPKTQSAILHQLLVIGEAVKRLSPEFKAQHAALPWSAIAGMRDRLIHAYDSVDLDEVWTTLRRDLPEVTRYLRPLLQPPSRDV